MGQSPATKHADELGRETADHIVPSGGPIAECRRGLGPNSKTVNDGDYEYTLYTSCYSDRTRTYYYNTYEDPAIHAYPLDSVALDGGAVVKVPAAL